MDRPTDARAASAPRRRSATGQPSTLADDCGEIERCLLTVARFTGGRRHHARTLATAGVGTLETAAERRARHAQALRRRALDPEYAWVTDPLAAAAPLSGHGATQVDAGLYPVLAVIEDLYRARPVDIARALTLDRSTVARHLDTLERRGLVFRERGLLRRMPRAGLTVTGFNAVKALREARVQRLARALEHEPALERRLMLLCLRRLADALHADVSAAPLPREFRDVRARVVEDLPPRALSRSAGMLGRRHVNRRGPESRPQGDGSHAGAAVQYVSGMNVWESIGGRT
jgi:DNA-binding MarR family transcriptional regulator